MKPLFNIVSRKTAKEKGLTFYFTGKPCKNKHLAQRRTINATCMVCAKNTINEFRKQNKRHIQKSWKRYYKQNKQHILQNGRIWNKNNNDKIKIHRKNRLVKVKSSPLLLTRHRATAAQKASKRRVAIKQATPVWLTEMQKQQINLIYLKCAKQRTIRRRDVHVDHIVPIKGRNVCGLHVPWNLQIIPANKNRSKGNR